MGSGAKLYMKKGFLRYEEVHKYFHHIWGVRYIIYDFAPDHSEFPNIWGTILFYFLSVFLTYIFFFTYLISARTANNNLQYFSTEKEKYIWRV